MDELAKYLLEQIVSEPKKIKVEMSEVDQDTVKLVATVDPDDMGKVIGKGGKVIQAVRTLLGATAIKANKRVFFTLSEPGLQATAAK